MSDIIKLLPDSVANQIAAGEVIQRPASVIKELVENAIDAGATSIKIILKDAGRTLTQVLDNGCGMSDTDARLAFERHSTSKITCADDLFSLHTMGFRGEALASIAAISQVELRTMKRGSQMGTKICINASKCESQEPEYCPEGCNFMIKNIFFNVPARRKFLKSNQVELSNIVREFEKLALVNYSTEFTLIHNDNTMFQLMGGDSFKRRITSLFSRSLEQQLIPIETETSLVKLNGYIGRPENARKRNALQYLFVNGRHMRHPYFHKAIISCYEQLIPSDEQPNYFLHFYVDPHTIDVNIHPTKNEIKFENEQAIWQILSAAVKEALGKFSAVPSIDFDTEDMVEIPAGNTSNIYQPAIEFNPSYNPFNEGYGKHNQTTSARKATQPISHIEKQADDNLKNWDTLYANFEKKFDSATSEQVTVKSSILDQSTTPLAIFDSNETMLLAENCRFVQLKNKYIITTSDKGIIIIDQYRAHTRILFDRLMNSKNETVKSQRVLFPEVIQLSSSQNLILEELQEEMEKMGFELAFLGNNSWSVNSVPSSLKGMNVNDLIHEVIDSVMTGGKDISTKISEHIALSSAKTAAIQYGQTLTEDDMSALANDLMKSTQQKYTPDGKLIINFIPTDDVIKMFS